jgi:hypothetical protein
MYLQPPVFAVMARGAGAICFLSFLLLLPCSAGQSSPPLFKIGKGKNVGFITQQGGLLVSPTYEGCSERWHEGFLWVVASADEYFSGNFIGSNGRELMSVPAGQYFDEVVAAPPGFWDGRAIVELDDHSWAVVTPKGILVPGSSWDAEVMPFKKDSKLAFIDLDGKEFLSTEYEDGQPFIGRFAPVARNAKWGLLDKRGALAVPIEYDQIRPQSGGYWFVEKTGKVGLLGPDGMCVVPLEYDGVRRRKGDAITVLSGGKWGIVNVLSGGVVVSCQYDQIEYLGGKAAWAKLDGRWGLIAYDGTVLQPFEFDSVMWVSPEAGLWKARQAGKYGLVNADGEMLLPCNYRSIDKAADGFVIVRDGEGAGLFHAPDKRFVLSPEYDRVIYWSESSGKSAVVRSGNQWGLASLRDGTLLLPTEHELLRPWRGVLKAEKEGLLALYDYKGREVLPWETHTTELPDTYMGFVNGYGKVVCKGKAGLIDEQGEIVLPCHYQDVGAFSEGLVPVMRDGQWGYVNLKGEWIIHPQYANAHSFLSGFAAVQRNGKYGYIDKDGREKIPFRYEDAGHVYNDRAPVAREGDGKVLWGLIDISGEVVLPIEYDCLEWVDLDLESSRYHGRVTWKVF